MAGLLTLLCLALAAGRTRADDAEPTYEARVAALSEEDVARGLQQVDESFAKQRLGAALWWSGWTGFNVFNIALGIQRYVSADTRLQRDNWLVSVIGAGLFVTAASSMPLPGLYGHRRLSRMPSETDAEKRTKLCAGLHLLAKSARIETTNSNFAAHLTAVGYAVISTGYVWLRNRDVPSDRLGLALGLQLGTSIAFGELTLWTVPRRARRDLRRFAQTVPPRRTARPDALTVGFGPTSLQLRLRL